MPDTEKTPHTQRHDACAMAAMERRDFLRKGVLISGCLILGWRATAALAQDKPMLDPDDYQARALEYVEDLDHAREAAGYQAGQRCANCAFFTGPTQTCGLFPDYRVAENGWCSSWTASDV